MDDRLNFVCLQPAFWEGRVHVEGLLHGRQVTGRGFIERHGYAKTDDMTSFFKRIGKVVLKEVAKIVPMNPTPQDGALSRNCSCYGFVLSS